MYVYNIKVYQISKVLLNNSTLNPNYSVGFEREIFSPLTQFEIRDLLSLDLPLLGDLHISITNIGFYLIIRAFFILVINLLSTNYNKLVSNK